jgi:peptide deformylase
MPTLDVVHYPDPFLRRKAEEIASPDETLDTLIRDMFAVMDEEGGIGLAAPQIGVSRRIIVVSVKEDSFERLALINPVIEHLSKESEVREEGCLSLPGVHADVERSVEAVVRGTTKSGRQVEISARSLLARVLQHEIDHLDGVLFIDRIDDAERERIAADLAVLEEQYAAPQPQ